jgi:glycerol-3-phosphate dehydrogenase
VLDLTDDPAGAPLRPGFRLGFEYSDCVADDCRLVIANALAARERGAAIRPRTRCVAARRESGRWTLVLQAGGRRETATARALINAAGPWVARVIEMVLHRPARTRLRLVKGSHIVVPRLHAHDRAYLLQNDDGRFVFAIPYLRDFTLIGTTEIDVADDPADAAASAEEILYLCRLADSYFRTPVEPSKVKWTFAGVRALVDDGSARPSDVSRDYTLKIDGAYGEPPLISVFGGKLTTHRRLAEKLMAKLAHWFVLRPPWTADTPLPGGDLGAGGVEALVTELHARWPFLSGPHARRLADTYGRRAWKILNGAGRLEDLGPRLVGDLHLAELEYLRREEWARTAEDVLWRRTKLGLTASAAEIEAIEAAIGPPAPAATLAGRRRDSGFG